MGPEYQTSDDGLRVHMHAISVIYQRIMLIAEELYKIH